MEVNTGRWCSSRACFGHMWSVLDGEVAVLICCTAVRLNFGILQASHVPGADGGSDCRPTADSNYDAHESTGLRRYSWANSAGVGGATEKFPCRLRILRY